MSKQDIITIDKLNINPDSNIFIRLFKDFISYMMGPSGLAPRVIKRSRPDFLYKGNFNKPATKDNGGFFGLADCKRLHNKLNKKGGFRRTAKYKKRQKKSKKLRKK
tara:strand:+ start:5970 stop:6287 length:318 start_codon:yes stop_codon:yes gene_type:complete